MASLHSHETFHPFPKLPAELRLNVWEQTWPEARVIELTCGEFINEHDTFGTQDFGRAVSLRPLCTFSRWTQFVKEGSYRDYEEEGPLESCSIPVALHVCQESRTRALRHYVKVQHSTLERSIFFVNPRLDILWITMDASDYLDQFGDLIIHYGTQLSQISRVLIEDEIWSHGESLIDFLNLLDGLATVCVYIDTDSNGARLGGQQMTQEMCEKAWALVLSEQLSSLRGRKWKIQYIDYMAAVHYQYQLRS